MITKTAGDFCKEAGIFTGLSNRVGNMFMGHGAIAGNPVQNAIEKALASGKALPKNASPEVIRAARAAQFRSKHPIISRLPQPALQMMAKGILGATRFGINRFSPENKKILWDSIVQKSKQRGASQKQLDLMHDMFFTAKPVAELKSMAQGMPR